MYQPKTGAKCSCKRGIERDNCSNCEGTGEVIDFKRIRNKRLFEPHGFFTICNMGGIEVEINPSGDGIRYRFNYGQDNLQDEEIFEAAIIYEPNEDDPAGDFEAGFMHDETFYPLGEFMRVNY